MSSETSQVDQPHRILLVVDDPAVARSLEDGLRREGYAVTWKASGSEGISHARDHHPHLSSLPDLAELDSASQPPVGPEDAEYNSAPSRVGLLPPGDDSLRKPIAGDPLSLAPICGILEQELSQFSLHR